MPNRPVSQRPIRRDYLRRVNNYRIPEDGPLTPRLRQKNNAEAIGFIHDFSERDDDHED